MNLAQEAFIFIFGLVNFGLAIKGLYEVKEKNVYGLTPWLGLLGIFVWGDATIICLFWTLSAVASYVLQSWLLFCLIVSLFWVVRSLGETIYWLNEQFAVHHRNEPKSLAGFKFFGNDSIWFIYQIIWQCVTVFSLVAVIYLAHKLWVN